MADFSINIGSVYQHPELPIAFKITYSEIAGTEISPYWMEFFINNDHIPARSNLLTNYSQLVSQFGNSQIDLRRAGIWVDIYFNSEQMPFQLARTENEVIGRWLSIEAVSKPQAQWSF